MQMAAVLASNNFAAEALNLSDLALAELGKQSSSMVRVVDVSESDIRAFQATVRADLQALTGADKSRPEQ